MYDPTQTAQPMNYSDLFMAQNLGLQPNIPAPMSGAQSMPQSMPMSGPQNVQMPPEINHLANVVQQYTQNKNDQQNNSGLVQQILSNRMQPDTSDASKSIFLSNQNGPGGYVSPDQTMADRYKEQLAPFTQGLGLANQSAELSGRLMNNNITAQTGLPMAMAQLKAEQMKNDIMAQTGMSAAQADIALKNSQAGYYGSALQRDIAEKQFDYQNNPQMQQARMMSQYLGGMGGVPAGANQPSSNASLPQSMPSPQQPNVQSRSFNPMGAMLAKQFGLENMQINPQGQVESIPGVITPGQKEQDTNFAQSYQTYANQGGAQRTANSLKTIDDIISQLKTGQLTTGGMLDAASMGPNGEETWTGRLLNSPILVARTRIANSILPQAKSLFGARVTNFDAQSLINSQGLDPLADTNTNIAKLEALKSALVAGQNDLQTSGQYFATHGTLAGYNPPVNQTNSASNIPSGAIQMLRQNPSFAPAFEQKYGVSAKDYMQ